MAFFFLVRAEFTSRPSAAANAACNQRQRLALILKQPWSGKYRALLKGDSFLSKRGFEQARNGY